mmetsp:Transcript_41907/g.94681  ORF Transcript_41907/g.94681 Transcript_41907/m.94681 type:complete len:436 (-) Transcript_41907:139-1446(-)|eukprot:CAMPEP_0172587450 /NCGR_PEP_ID=MMETSP1068-20121228/6497_1 /TAXON_ID=35684 /ORGANISM="Pseudopedinella elastica, Strain CCMP716" /LENGTH=435 /DNA_ID=CAMNT_0013382479 /DNA_START=93 /DNA_END=1400 /DNA_ORIENTATION=+
MFKQFTEAQRTALRAHKYSGADLSLTYKYILSPFAAACVERLPLWVAPNLITAVGLALPVSTYALGHYLSPTFECGNVPRWFYLWSAFSLVFYQTLDNMDGKQARRTGSSSPLGQVFDHGCDALNAFFSGTNFAVTCCCGTQDPALLAAVLLVPTVPFFTNTWEEYHTGSMILPVVNGPSEGLLIAAALNVAVWGGGDFWRAPLADRWPPLEYLAGGVALGLETLLGPSAATFLAFGGGGGEGEGTGEGAHTPRDLFVISAVVLVSGTALLQMYGVLAHTWGKLSADRTRLMNQPTGLTAAKLLAPLVDLFPLAWVLGFGGAWMAASWGGEGGLAQRRPRAFAALLTFLIVEAVVSLIVAHVTKSRYTPLRVPSLPLPAAWAAVAKFGTSPAQQEQLLLAYLLGVIVYLAAYLAFVVSEFTSTLNIKCFSIRKSA